LDEHPIIVRLGSQKRSVGPAEHIPSFGPGVPPATQFAGPPLHELACVACPGASQTPVVHVLPGHAEVAGHWPPALAPATHLPHVGFTPCVVHGVPLSVVHVPLGHCDATVQNAPAFVPPTQVLGPLMQRLPPQVVAPTATQLALVRHGVAAKLSQVSHMHFSVVCPAARQFGLAVVSVLVVVPVVLVRSIGSDASTLVFGRQSRLVLPKASFGEEPSTSHAVPASIPPLHVPPRTPSFASASPTQRGHGFGFVAPPKTREVSDGLLVLLPFSMFAVPVNAPLKLFSTHVDTPPAESGRNVPK
jgi:hypothetical protein